MLQRLKLSAECVLAYLGDAAHRRFAATLIALAVTHFAGRALDAGDVSTYIELLIGGLGGAWSRSTPKLDDVRVD